MHKSEIYPDVVRRIVERRGSTHIFYKLEPAKTALIVIDMQNCWVMKDQPGYSPACSGIVPNINRLAATLRDCGGQVSWVQLNGSREVTANWQRYRDFHPTQALFNAWSDALTPGQIGYALWAGLDVRPGDLKIEKHRFSAFIQGSSNLHAELTKRAIDTVLITGTATNISCEATARDANMLDYRVIMVSDANVTRSNAEHNATLSNLFGLFADVMTTEEIVTRLKRATKAQQAK